MGATVEHMGVDHGGFHRSVPQELLDRTNIVALGQQMGGKAVTQGMATRVLGHTRLPQGLFEYPLNRAFVKVVASSRARARA